MSTNSADTIPPFLLEVQSNIFLAQLLHNIFLLLQSKSLNPPRFSLVTYF